MFSVLTMKVHNDSKSANRNLYKITYFRQYSKETKYATININIFIQQANIKIFSALLFLQMEVQGRNFVIKFSAAEQVTLVSCLT